MKVGLRHSAILCALMLVACTSPPAAINDTSRDGGGGTGYHVLQSIFPVQYFQGFEVDLFDWMGWGGSDIIRVPSGSDSFAYASGIAAATGNYYARLRTGPPLTCGYGSGPQPWYMGPLSSWGCSHFVWEPYDTSVSIYLDTAYAAANPDRRFDYDSVIADSEGGLGGDFVFNVGTTQAGTTPAGFIISASQESTRCLANPDSNQPITITESGWYIFEHQFRDNGSGVLAVTMRVIRPSDGAVLGSWVISNPTDLIAQMGGNFYAWFVNNEIDGLAIDDTERAGGGTCDALAGPIRLTKELVFPRTDTNRNGIIDVPRDASTTFTMRLLVTNPTASPLTDVTIKDVLPPSLTVTAPNGATVNGSTLTWEVGTVGPGQTVNLTFSASTSGKEKLGDYTLNKGATMKAVLEGKHLTIKSDGLEVEVL